MHAPIPLHLLPPPVPAIPPCDFDAQLSRAVASPEATAPYIGPSHRNASATACFPRRRFARISNFLTGMRYRLADTLRRAWRCYVVLSVPVVSILIAVHLGIVVATMTRSAPLPLLPSAACGDSQSASIAAPVPTAVSEFK